VNNSGFYFFWREITLKPKRGIFFHNQKISDFIKTYSMDTTNQNEIIHLKVRSQVFFWLMSRMMTKFSSRLSDPPSYASWWTSIVSVKA